MSAEADQIAIYMKVETTFGVAATGNYQTMRLVSESFGQDTNFIESQEIVSDRQVADLIRASLSASGDVAFELSYGTYDEWLVSALKSAGFGSEVTVAASTLSMDDSDNSINDSGSGLAGFAINQWIRTTGFTTAANNAFFRIVSVAAGKLVLESGTGGTVVTESAGDSVEITQGSKITQGTTVYSYSIEREYTDTANEFVMNLGMTLGGMTLNVTPDEIVTGVFNFLGSKAESAAATAAGTPVAASTTSVMNAVDNVVAILEDGAVYGSTAFTMALTNNLRERPEIAALGAISIGAGKVGVTGTLEAYFETKAVMDKYLGNTPTKLAVIFQDDAGNGYVFDFPQVKYTNGRRSGGGINTDIFALVDWTAYKDPTELNTISIQRFPV